jgi:hypothetical protein
MLLKMKDEKSFIINDERCEREKIENFRQHKPSDFHEPNVFGLININLVCEFIFNIRLSFFISCIINFSFFEPFQKQSHIYF